MYDNVRRQCISVHIRCMTMWGWHVTGSCRFDDDMWRSQAWPFLSEALTWPASVTYVTRLRTICWPLLSQQRWIPTLWLPCVTELQGAPIYNNIQPHNIYSTHTPYSQWWHCWQTSLSGDTHLRPKIPSWFYTSTFLPSLLSILPLPPLLMVIIVETHKLGLKSVSKENWENYWAARLAAASPSFVYFYLCICICI